MDFKAIMRHMPNIWASKDLISYVMVFVFLFLLAFLAFGRLGFAYNEAQQTKQQIEEMTSFVDEWNTLAQSLNQVKYRPVTIMLVDDVQSNILLMLSANHLDLKTFKNTPAELNKENGMLYEITFQGKWEAVVKILSNFHVKDALISIQYVKLEPTKEREVLVMMSYKIYIK